MNTLIFRTIAPLLVVVMLVFSVFITLRGHNEPGGGFIGGLIAASAIAIYGMAAGPQATVPRPRVARAARVRKRLIIGGLSKNASVTRDDALQKGGATMVAGGGLEPPTCGL